MPKVSVIIPTYNRSQYLRNSIDSVLNQSYQDFELIVVDDGSTDDSKEVLSKFNGRIRYFYQENMGVSAARNKGIREAKGEYIAFLDSDDTWAPEKLEKQMLLFKNKPEVSLQYSFARYKDNDLNYDDIRPRHVSKNLQDFLYGDTVLPTPTVILRKYCLDKVGLFDEDLYGIEDYDLWLRIVREFNIDFISEVLADVNICSDNLSKNSLKMYLSHINVYTKILNDLKDEINKSIILSKLSKYYYLAAKEYYIKNFNRLAFKKLISALKANPLLGRLFISKGNSLSKNIYLLIKPYLFLSVLIFKSILK